MLAIRIGALFAWGIAFFGAGFTILEQGDTQFAPWFGIVLLSCGLATIPGGVTWLIVSRVRGSGEPSYDEAMEVTELGERFIAAKGTLALQRIRREVRRFTAKHPSNIRAGNLSDMVDNALKAERSRLGVVGVVFTFVYFVADWKRSAPGAAAAGTVGVFVFVSYALVVDAVQVTGPIDASVIEFVTDTTRPVDDRSVVATSTNARTGASTTPVIPAVSTAPPTPTESDPGSTATPLAPPPTQAPTSTPEPTQTSTPTPEPTPTSTPTPEPTPTSTPTPEPTQTNTPVPPATTETATSSSEILINVSSNQAWTDTRLAVVDGDVISISGLGSITFDAAGRRSGPEGSADVPDCSALITDPAVPMHSLVGNVAEISSLDGSGFYVGSSFEGLVPLPETTSPTGRLFLGFNDGFIECDRSGLNSGAVSDNSGSFTAIIVITPAR